MDVNRFNEFRKKIDAKLNHMDAKISRVGFKRYMSKEAYEKKEEV